MRRARLAALVLTGWTGLALLTFGPSDDVPRDRGAADEPVTMADGTTVIVRCDQTAESVDWNLVSPYWDPDDLIDGCDYRRTGEDCEEDQVCAIAQINETGDYRR